jgi:uncharacterized protein YbbC (DUF1343 family)
VGGVQFGIDVALATPGALTGRIGLVTNDAARTSRDPARLSRVAMQRARIRLVRLFSPEHGLHATVADGAVVDDAADSLTGLPVVSLYGKNLQPARETLADLDAVVFDLPDIGARFYTYVWTLWHVLEACAEFRVPLVVLDRPNPLGGILSDAEGPLLDVEKFSSFVGRAAIPIRHSLTVGELARLWNAGAESPADLRIIPCSGWRRAMHWPDTGLPFVQTSPASASYESALLYPGLCLFEATNLSVGRGTPLAFQAVAAPWLRATEIASRFNALNLPGVSAVETNFSPTESLFAEENCHAVRLVVRNPKLFRPVRAGLNLLALVISGHQDFFHWSNYPTAANPTGALHFEYLIGQTGVRETLEKNSPNLPALIEDWTTMPGWAERVKPFLLYD